jgi:uncharacterized repeat protein (TIGR01451 family)
VVNNSWGDCGTSYDNWYQDVVDSWHAAGIYPVFANVNASNCGYGYPPGCNTVGNPARYGNVTGVGSTGQSDGQYATHSNWGPTDNDDPVNPHGYPSIKPQVVAPGVDIRSSYSGSDSDYGSSGGTSMSAPHVAALVALMWQAGPCLEGDYEATETLLESTAVPIPYASGCGGEGPGNVPNHATGWGEIDALEAVNEAMSYCGFDWLPWVSESHESASIPPLGSDEVTLTFDCSDPGDFSGILRISHNDPCLSTQDVPLSLHCVGTVEVDLEASQHGEPCAPVPGEPITYDLMIANDGANPVSGASVTDTFPSELTLVSWTCSGAGGGTCSSGGLGNIDDTVDLPVGASVHYVVSATVDPATTRGVTNQVTVSLSAEYVDLDPANNQSTLWLPIGPSLFCDCFETGDTSAWSRTVP